MQAFHVGIWERLCRRGLVFTVSHDGFAVRDTTDAISPHELNQESREPLSVVWVPV